MMNDVQQRRDERGWNQARLDEGFSLIELLIVMSIILILSTLAIPQMRKLIKNANETSAQQSVKTISDAERQYSVDYPTRGYTCTLSELGGDPKSGAPNAQGAQLIDPTLAAGQKSGYTFAITNCTKITVANQDKYTSFEVTAVPQSVGHTGDSGYCDDDNNQVRKDRTGGTNCTEALGQ